MKQNYSYFLFFTFLQRDCSWNLNLPVLNTSINRTNNSDQAYTNHLEFATLYFISLATQPLMEKLGKKFALLVGCNYPNTEDELEGCHNDVVNMQKTLINRFRFEPNRIELLTDNPGDKIMPTGANIKAALNRMVDQARPGGVVFFHFSGHGTLFPSDNSPKKVEAIVPCDYNLITSEYRLIFFT